jgi:hypothetical protein
MSRAVGLRGRLASGKSSNPARCASRRSLGGCGPGLSEVKALPTAAPTAPLGSRPSASGRRGGASRLLKRMGRVATPPDYRLRAQTHCRPSTPTTCAPRSPSARRRTGWCSPASRCSRRDRSARQPIPRALRRGPGETCRSRRSPLIPRRVLSHGGGVRLAVECPPSGDWAAQTGCLLPAAASNGVRACQQGAGGVNSVHGTPAGQGRIGGEDSSSRSGDPRLEYRAPTRSSPR